MTDVIVIIGLLVLIVVVITKVINYAQDRKIQRYQEEIQAITEQGRRILKEQLAKQEIDSSKVLWHKIPLDEYRKAIQLHDERHRFNIIFEPQISHIETQTRFVEANQPYNWHSAQPSYPMEEVNEQVEIIDRAQVFRMESAA